MCKREEYALAASDSVLLYETSNEQAYCFTKHKNNPAQNAKDWKKVEEIAQLRMDHRKAVCPGNLSYVAFAVMDLARVKGYLNKHEEANELIRQAQEIWKISFGPNNKFSHKNTIQQWMQDEPWLIG